jgi:RNA polymerase primary sigma factor
MVAGRHTSSTDERVLVENAKRGGAAERDELVAAFHPLLGRVARMYTNAPGVDRAELMQEGVVGLLRALERYDPALGVPFWGYASWWARNAMQQLVSEMARPIVLSDRALRQVARVKDAQRRLAQARGREPGLHEIAEETGLPRERIDGLLAAERPARSFDEPVGGEGDGTGATVGDFVADPCSQDAFDSMPQRLFALGLPALLACLTERERRIIDARFGLVGEERTLREIAADLGVSAERVRQIEEIALGKLRLATDEVAVG